MWWTNQIGKGAVYFYPEEFRCYNFKEKCLFAVEPETKDEWATGGNSKSLGPECLGRWFE